jgi:hypothetical protein
MQDSDCWRMYGLVGVRTQILWEGFKWRVVSLEANGNVLPNDTANYFNNVANDLYGPTFGVGNEWLLGDTPVGAFSVSLDVEGAPMIDVAKGRPKYELGDRSTAAQHGRNFLELSPEADASLAFWWYPYEGIVVRFGYDIMGIFNTVSAPRPVDFNFGTITPGYEQSTFRLIQAFNFGVGVIF